MRIKGERERTEGEEDEEGGTRERTNRGMRRVEGERERTGGRGDGESQRREREQAGGGRQKRYIHKLKHWLKEQRQSGN